MIIHYMNKKMEKEYNYFIFIDYTDRTYLLPKANIMHVY